MGLDPRGFVLFSYGGAGPVFAAFIARELGSKLAYVPSDSGVFSAFGMLTSDIVFQEESSTTLRSPLSEANIKSINQLYQDLNERLLQRFAATGFDVGQVALARNVDMRFGMQVHELDVDVPMGTLDQAVVERLLNDFVAKYESIYGANSAYLGAGMEFVTFRVIGTVNMERPVLDMPENKETAASLIDCRRAYLRLTGLWTPNSMPATD